MNNIFKFHKYINMYKGTPYLFMQYNITQKSFSDLHNMSNLSTTFSITVQIIDIRIAVTSFLMQFFNSGVGFCTKTFTLLVGSKPKSKSIEVRRP